MPLLTNRFFLYDAVKLMLWTGVLVCTLFAVIAALAGTLNHMGMAFVMLGLVLAGFLLLFLAIAAVLFGNRFPVEFRVGPEGIEWKSLSRRGRFSNRAAIVAGVLAGSAGTAGAGLLAAAQEFGGLEWSEIRKLKPYPEERVITVMNSWRVVTRLYCTPENYAYTAQLVEWYMASNAARPRG
ncbi:MAG: hypothetical protein NTY38_07665 [Acidobacteria bacterium]|nr:hypothetical protein [Acidobacteriota bacterium]